MGLLALVDRFVRGYTRVAWELTALLLAALSINIVVQVFFRYVLHRPLTSADESARFLLIWITFLGAVVPLERGNHFVVELLADALPQPIRRAVLVFANLVVLWMLVIFIREGSLLATLNMRQISPAMGVPFGIVYASIPIGGGLMLGVVLRDILRASLGVEPTVEEVLPLDAA